MPRPYAAELVVSDVDSHVGVGLKAVGTYNLSCERFSEVKSRHFTLLGELAGFQSTEVSVDTYANSLELEYSHCEQIQCSCGAMRLRLKLNGAKAIVVVEVVVERKWSGSR